MCLATVIIPTYDHGPTIRYALASALRQTVQELEVVIIGDGVTEENKRLLAELAATDARVRFVDHPKHERRGEPYRHQVLSEARGRIVCYLCDRDLWLPCHVQRMLNQLQSADFTHSLSVHVLPDGTYRFFPADLALPEYRRYMLHVANRVAFSCAAHTMEVYRRLPFGWRTTPPETQTDWYMFQQFLQLDDCRASSSVFPSAITFPSPPRYGWSTERRLAELRSWVDTLANEAGRADAVLGILQEAIRARDTSSALLQEEIRARDLSSAGLMRQVDELSQTVADFHASPLMACRRALLRIPGLPYIVRGAAKTLRRLSVH